MDGKVSAKNISVMTDFLKIFHLSSNPNIAETVHKFLTWLYLICLFYDWPYLEESLLFSTYILGSVFSDYVVFYRDISFILPCAIRVKILSGICMCFIII